MLNQELSSYKKGKPHDVDIHVGSRVRLRRSALGLSQDQLGAAIGLSFQQVQKYERGANRIGASRLYEMSQILQTPISYFFEGFSELGLAEEGDSSYEADPVLKRETLELMRAYHQIQDVSQRRKILKLVKGLAEEYQRENPTRKGRS
ncbi:MAG: helix-turn-helix transcriptional regulator [Alphaproteobacteria bacterium]|nr:helix-turn-helix transcriptional regulator [Alphaproteobacteria bacterium]